MKTLVNLNEYYETVKNMNKFKSKSVCITGTLALMTREEAVGEIEKAGGTFDKALGSYTSYLVVADKPGAVKLKKAKSYGTTVLTEKQFLDILKDKPTLDIIRPKGEPIKPIEPQVDINLQSRDW
jgi:NAD-dependent DNA ligase